MFQAGGSALCEGAAADERFRLIDELAGHHSVSWLCRKLGVARSGTYAWRESFGAVTSAWSLPEAC